MYPVIIFKNECLVPVSDKYPYVECVTYKKWKPLGRVGIIVMMELGGKRPRSSYKLTRKSEDVTISFYNDKKIDSILGKRKQLLRYYPYPIITFIERNSKALLHKVGIRKRYNQLF